MVGYRRRHGGGLRMTIEELIDLQEAGSRARLLGLKVY
ncbi:hypothetical protein CUJ84_pRLN3000143 (plasmid) [Rhizobium leguminosarum]|uniref:Uncharacterized protein n=1 Tax=Rhizobium leguminosarum TaxID=384 RepID=A0A2K9ZGC6_RHILE|nr:hypothetical protein CUJ84_pRLN3000143 [Rhizobium leguminosarum]